MNFKKKKKERKTDFLFQMAVSSGTVLASIWPGSVPAADAVCGSCPPPLTLVFFSIPTRHGRKEEVKEADLEKEAALEAELKAARERAVMPLDVRMTQFRDMLLERGVKHFNRNTTVTSSVMLDT